MPKQDESFYVTEIFNVETYYDKLKSYYNEPKHLEQIDMFKQCLLKLVVDNPDMNIFDLCALNMYGNISMTVKNLNLTDKLRPTKNTVLQ